MAYENVQFRPSGQKIEWRWEHWQCKKRELFSEWQFTDFPRIPEKVLHCSPEPWNICKFPFLPSANWKQRCTTGHGALVLIAGINNFWHCFTFLGKSKKKVSLCPLRPEINPPSRPLPLPDSIKVSAEIGESAHSAFVADEMYCQN